MAETNLGNVAVVPRGAWSSAATYKKNNLVGNAGNMYLAMKDVPAGTVTSNTKYWMLSATKGLDGDVTAAAMTAAIAYTEGELQNRIDVAYSGIVAHTERITTLETEVTPLLRGGTGATTPTGARTNLGAAPTVHAHAATDVTSGTLPLIRGGTGQTTAAGIRNTIGLGNTIGALGYEHGGLDSTSLAQAQSNLGVAFSSTTTPATASTLGTLSMFRADKFGRFVNFQVRYSTTIGAGLNTDAAIIPEAYRPESETLHPLSVYVADTDVVVKAYATKTGTIAIRTSAEIGACVLSGSWTTA